MDKSMSVLQRSSDRRTKPKGLSLLSQITAHSGGPKFNPPVVQGDVLALARTK